MVLFSVLLHILKHGNTIRTLAERALNILNKSVLQAKQLSNRSLLSSVVDPDTYSEALWIRIRISNTDPDKHMQC